MIESRKCLEQQSRASVVSSPSTRSWYSQMTQEFVLFCQRSFLWEVQHRDFFFFFPFFLFVCPQDDMSTIKQTIMCQYLSLLFSLFSVRLHFMWYSHPFPSPSITPPLRCVPVLCYRGGVLPSDSAPGHENVSVEKRG